MLQQLNCLIVDDDPMYVMVAHGILSTLVAGKIETAGNGRAGLAKIRESQLPFDLVMLDLNMPDIDGLAFMRSVAEANFTGSIAITSGESEAVRRSAEAMGKLLGISILGALGKPLTLDSVATVLARAGNSQRRETIKSQHQLADLELTPYYQPQYDLSLHRLVGFEALIRLTAKDGQVFGPDKLFKTPMNGDDLNNLSLEIVCKVLSESKEILRRLEGPDISINFDASVLERADAAPRLQEIARSYGIEPRRVCLEMTEKTLPKDPSRLVESLARLSMMGFKLSLDDYGMGASSFELLRLCPFSEIKIDRTIVAAAATDKITRSFLHTTAVLAHELELVSVAEGVEILDASRP